MMILIAMSSLAQETYKKFSFEFSAGSSLVTQDLGGTDLNAGMGFEGIFSYRFMPHMGIYAGWGWNRFGSAASFAGDHIDFEETGYVFGVHFQHPIQSMPVSYYFRAGGLYNHIELENKEGQIIEDTGHGFGWQLSTGFVIPLGSRWNLQPGLKFNSLSRTLSYEDIDNHLELRHVSLRLGISKSF